MDNGEQQREGERESKKCLHKVHSVCVYIYPFIGYIYYTQMHCTLVRIVQIHTFPVQRSPQRLGNHHTHTISEFCEAEKQQKGNRCRKI